MTLGERSECLFCRIVAGEVPCDVLVETSRTLAFRDLHPVAPVHVLVVPRRHVEHAAAVTPEHAEEVAEMITTARAVAEAEGVLGRGYRLVFNVGEDAGNTVGHLHLQVLGGRALEWPPG